MLIRLLKDERGATAIEYGLIAALISVALVMAAVVDGKPQFLAAATSAKGASSR